MPGKLKNRGRMLKGILLVLLVSLGLFRMGIVRASGEAVEELRNRYQQFLAGDGQFAAWLPVQVDSKEQNDILEAKIFAVLEQDFSLLTEHLTSPADWCELVPLVFNVKACTHQEKNEKQQLTFYVGRKYYEPPEKAFELKYDFSIRASQENYLHIVLTAEQGPFGTSDYRLELEALGIDGKTFLSVHTSYRQSMLGSLATSGYLATLGRGKVGFTIVGGDAENPQYVQGVRGIIERNAVRYYLAFKAYLETRDLAPDKRFMAAAELWYDLTERYHKQLYEMEKAEYLGIKRRERRQQLRLEKQLSETAAVSFSCPADYPLCSLRMNRADYPRNDFSDSRKTWPMMQEGVE
jgi:hypothetical protein